MFKGKYKKAAEALRALLDRKTKEAKDAGRRGLKHSPEYYAARIIQTTGMDKSLDARTLAKMATEGYGDNDFPSASLTKKYVQDTPYQVMPNGIKKQKDGSYTSEEIKTFKEMNEEVSTRQIKDLEVFADRLLNKFGVDIEFTRHFADRMNDKRNNPEIKIAELQQLFKKIAKQKAVNIKQNPDTEVVLKDMQKDLNLPVVIKYNKNSDEFEVVNKTIMRKKGFATSNKTIEYK